ncbi:MAG: hypothetical protein IJA61_01725 [Clostridia bacterium]|nr:hypothetical protein [Clostridia bacterium]
MYKDTWFENLDENMLSDKLAEKELRYVGLSAAWTFGDDGRIVISVAVRPPVGSSENDMGLGEDTLYFNEYGVVDLTKSGYGPAKLKDEKHLTEMWLGVMRDSNKDIRINGHAYMEDFVKYHKSNIMASYNKKVKELDDYRAIVERVKDNNIQALFDMTGLDLSQDHQEEMGE